MRRRGGGTWEGDFGTAGPTDLRIASIFVTRVLLDQQGPDYSIESCASKKSQTDNTLKKGHMIGGRGA